MIKKLNKELQDMKPEILPNRRAGVYKPTPVPSTIPELKIFENKYIINKEKDN